MKILRLRLAEYRGIRQREIEPLPRGVTVIHGPNEAGKSSLVEALDLLLDVKDSSRNRKVAAVRPVGRDEGSEIELEAEAGPYRFRYLKRFHKQRQTRLSVLRPEPEDWVGGEAHERVLAILGETVDLGLWRALRVQQGETLDLDGLSQSQSLAAALDRAAGGGDLDAAEETLYERIRAEFHRYFTPERNQERREIKDAVQALRVVEERYDELERRYRALEEDLGRSEALQARQRELQHELAAARGEAEQRGAASQRAEELAQAAQAAGQQAQRAAAVSRLLKDLSDLDSLATRAEKEAATAGAEAQRLQAELEPMGARLAELQTAAGAARQLAQRRRDDERLLARQREAASARRRLEAIREAQEEHSRTAEEMGRIALTEDLLKRLEAASRQAEAARTALGAASPRLRLTALRDLQVEVDGEDHPLAAQANLERPVERPLRLRLPDVADLEISPGSGVEDLAVEVRQGEAAVAELCATAGVADLAEARAAAEQRRSLEMRRDAAQSRLRESLGGRSPEDAAAEAERQEAAIREALDARPDEPPLPENAEEGGRLREEAEAAVTPAEEALEEFRRRESGLRSRLAEAEAAAERGRLALAGQSERRQWLEGQLAELGEPVEDEPLASRLATAEEDAAATRRDESAARQALGGLEPAREAQRAAEARRRVEGLERTLSELDKELWGVAEGLRVRGEEGLYEALGDAKAEVIQARRTRDSLLRRASAARRLFEVFDAAREESRANYRAPLQRRIDELGRRLFGPSFAVELDEDLSIAKRRLDGTSLDFDQLSVGAREQLAVLLRLACGMLVADDGGVPVILDDSLGHSDQQRLAGMAQLLEEAGRECQILVLTSNPERFAEVDGARRIDLGR